MDSFLDNKRVLVTGACGTVGRELVRQLLQQQSIDELICLDNNETELFFSNKNLRDTARPIFTWGTFAIVEKWPVK